VTANNLLKGLIDKIRINIPLLFPIMPGMREVSLHQKMDHAIRFCENSHYLKNKQGSINSKSNQKALIHTVINLSSPK